MGEWAKWVGELRQGALRTKCGGRGQGTPTLRQPNIRERERSHPPAENAAAAHVEATHAVGPARMTSLHVGSSTCPCASGTNSSPPNHDSRPHQSSFLTPYDFSRSGSGDCSMRA